MRIVFMGTPDFAVPTLEKIIEAGHEVVGVVTQPDKAKGRGHQVVFPPVKETALKYGLTVYQPKRVRDEAFVDQLKTLDPDVIVVVAFGQILPKTVLDLPSYGCVNVHASLLPKYRGAAPIQWAVINGEAYSGVTIMRMDEGLDTGDMIAREKIALDADETGGSLFDKLSAMGGRLLVQVLKELEDGTAVFEKQDDSQAGEYARMLTKSMGAIRFDEPAVRIERLIRGLNPWPSAYTRFRGKTLKIWKAAVSDQAYDRAPGEVAAVSKTDFTVQTGEGALIIQEVQMEGKKRMAAEAFLRGYSVSVGEKLE